MQIKNLEQYRALIFDCDGVVLNSNAIKTNAFYAISSEFGEDIASRFISYHKKNGGVSRYKKIEYLLKLVQKGEDEVLRSRLLRSYSEKVKNQLLKCEIAPQIDKIRYLFGDKQWIMVTGGDESEIKEVLDARKILQLFDGGVYGSPHTKHQIFKMLLIQRKIKFPAVYFGDSVHDYIEAKKVGLDFIFINLWTEFKGWKRFCKLKSIPTLSSLSELLNNEK